MNFKKDVNMPRRPPGSDFVSILIDVDICVIG